MSVKDRLVFDVAPGVIGVVGGKSTVRWENVRNDRTRERRFLSGKHNKFISERENVYNLSCPK